MKLFLLGLVVGYPAGGYSVALHVRQRLKDAGFK